MTIDESQKKHDCVGRELSSTANQDRMTIPTLLNPHPRLTWPLAKKNCTHQPQRETCKALCLALSRDNF